LTKALPYFDYRTDHVSLSVLHGGNGLACRRWIAKACLVVRTTDSRERLPPKRIPLHSQRNGALWSYRVLLGTSSTLPRRFGNCQAVNQIRWSPGRFAIGVGAR